MQVYKFVILNMGYKRIKFDQIDFDETEYNRRLHLSTRPSTSDSVCAAYGFTIRAWTSRQSRPNWARTVIVGKRPMGVCGYRK